MTRDLRDIDGIQNRRQDDDLRRDVLRTQIELGLDALDRGDWIEVDDKDLDSYLDRLSARE